MAKDTKIKDIKIVRSGIDNVEQEYQYFAHVGTGSCIPLNRDAIVLYADEPCVEACQLLYDLNIQTFSSGGHVDGKENATGEAFIGIEYDTLDENNKTIVERMIQDGIISNKQDASGRGQGIVFNISVPIHSDDMVGEVSDKLVKIASQFQLQDGLYGVMTEQQIEQGMFTRLEDGSYRDNATFSVLSEQEMKQSYNEMLEFYCGNMFSDDGNLYYITKDLLNKHLDFKKKGKSL